MNKKKSLTRKIVINFIVVGILLGLLNVFLMYRGYKEDIEQQYHDSADMIANTVESWVTPYQIAEYVEASKNENKSKINSILVTENYKRLRAQVNNMRKCMNLNDVYIVYYTSEEMHAYNGDKESWKPLHYILDCYSKEEEAYSLGESSSMNPDNRDLFAEVVETGKRQEKHIISDGEFGYNISSLIPIMDSDNNVLAVIGVEQPMSSIKGRVRNFMIFTMIQTLLVMCVLMCAVLVYLFRGVIKPIKVIASEAKLFGEKGDTVSEKIPKLKKTKDEIQMLSESIMDMEHGIIKYVDNIAKITAEKERISAELNVATQIQADMLPRIFPAFPDRSEFNVYATMTPAKEVGGDFYDFFMVDDNHIGLVMADVSGKGVPAALFMVIAKTLIKNRAQMGGTPSEILSYANEQLCEGNEAELFVTVWFAIVDITTGKGLAANAGHEHPAIRRADGSFELIIYRHSPAVATMEGMRFREHEFELNPGDRLYVYTDGVAEATDSNNELYGSDRMIDALKKYDGSTLEDLLHGVKKDIDDFVGEAPQFDDITMLGFDYNGNK